MSKVKSASALWVAPETGRRPCCSSLTDRCGYARSSRLVGGPLLTQRQHPQFFNGLLSLVCCLAVAPTGARAAAAASETNAPLYRYLFVVDTSSAMSRQKDLAIDTVHRLILSGINGRIKTGDVLGIWTFDEKLSSNTFPAEMWVPQRKLDYANRAYRFLRDQKLAKTARLNEVATAIQQAASASGALTVFLVTDGTSPLKGTPFDDAVNAMFKEHSTGMRKAKKPFVVVFIADQGRFVAHEITPGGGAIYIPAVRKAVASSNAERPPGVSVPKTNAATEPKPQPADKPKPSQSNATAAKTLSAEEIMVELARQSAQKRSNTVAATSPPPATPAQSIALKPEEPAPPAAAATTPPKAGRVDSPLPTTAERKADAAAPTIALARPTPQNAVESANKDASPPLDLAAKADAPPTEPPLSPSGKEAGETGTANPATGPTSVPAAQTESATTDPPPQQTAVLVAEGAGSNPQAYLLIGVVLLIVAALLGWLYFRAGRSTPQPSLISRSMDKPYE